MLKKSRMKKSRAVQMSLPARLVPHGLALGALLAGGPARAASAVTVDSVVAGAGRTAREAGTAASAYGQWLASDAAAYGQRLLAGDMAAIKIATFAFSGLIALVGLWLLVRGPRVRRLALVHRERQAEPGETGPAERPVRLLEAIAAAKAQMAISAAERKHAR